MKPSSWVFFLKYPYGSAIILCIWLGSLTMILISDELPVFEIVAINLVSSWLIAWLSFRANG